MFLLMGFTAAFAYLTIKYGLLFNDPFAKYLARYFTVLFGIATVFFGSFMIWGLFNMEAFASLM